MDTEDLRLAIYRHFVDTGAAPERNDLAAQLGASRARIDAGIDELEATRHLVLDQSGAIVMAHPFAAIPLGFSVMGRRTLWWGGCCWDSFALPHLVTDEPDVLVATRCPACDTPHAWVVGREAPPAGDQVAHFLVPAAHIWDDVVHTCSNQRIFCGAGCVDDWLARTDNQRGYVMDLPTLWRFASHWYDGRLDRGYIRREPAAAQDYLRSVGLIDPFWGTS
jgi:Alkylmercury lyase